MKDFLVESVQIALDSIIDKGNYKNSPDIKITQGSQEGDGYIAKTYAIDIKSDNGEHINLFVKYLSEDIKSWRHAFVEAFNTEYNFYTKIYPVLDQFQRDKHIQEPFNNVPKHFATNIKNDQTPPIVLENLRSLGYTLRDRKKPIDDAHLELSIKALAKYHAIHFAMKDQHPEIYKKLTIGVGDIFGKYLIQFGIEDTIRICLDQLINSFDPVLDKNILEHLGNLPEKLSDYLKKIFGDYDDYFIIVQGDCWSNNMMFLYNNQTGLPTNVKLIDWQCQRLSSPLFDFSYFFYTLATKKELDNAEHYFNLYYDTLSKRITELGSDPEKVYPHTIFRDHSRKYSLFGLCMCFPNIKAQLFEEDEVPNILNPGADKSPLESFSVILKNQDVYVKRMKDLLEYFINQNLL